MYFRARHYCPKYGRLNQKDSTNPLVSHYTYITNNPLSGTDPSGRVIILSNNKANEDALFSKLKSLGIDNAVTAHNAPNETIYSIPGKNAPSRPFPGNLEQEIFWRMLISPRIFRHNIFSTLESEVLIRIKICDAAKAVRFKFGTAVTSAQQPAMWNGNRFSGSASKAITSWFTGDVTGYKSGCRKAAAIVMLKGILDKRPDFDKRSFGKSHIGELCGTFMSNMIASDNDDWIPGDWGRITNRRITTDYYKQVLSGSIAEEPVTSGENIIYIGGTLSTGAAFANVADTFWGLYDDDMYRSLNEWFLLVNKWSGGNNDATLNRILLENNAIKEFAPSRIQPNAE